MMNSIFDSSGNEEMLSRINKLTAETPSLWGKMNVAQMCKHCRLAIEVAYGKQDLKINFVMKLFGRMLKNKVIYGGDLRKDSPTAKEFIVTEELDFEEEKNKLSANFSRFAKEGKAVIKLIKHPFWGILTYEEWDKLMWKHLDHHLRQFGV